MIGQMPGFSSKDSLDAFAVLPAQPKHSRQEWWIQEVVAVQMMGHRAQV